MEKREEFSTKDSIVIRNVPVPQEGDDLRIVTEVLAQLKMDNFLPEDDKRKVKRKGNINGKFGSNFVKLADKDFKV